MPRSNHTRTLQHFTAMQLIMSMQVTDSGRISYPNVDRVFLKNSDERMIPDPTMTIKQGLELMHDLLTLVDPGVYMAFHEALNSSIDVGSVRLNPESMKISADIAMAFLLNITQTVKTEMWEDPPHPCTFVMREVVANLLA